MRNEHHRPRHDVPGSRRRHARRLLWLTFLVSAVLLLGTAVAHEMTWELAPSIHVVWREGLSEHVRRELEDRYALARETAQHVEGNNWAYELLDISPGNIQELSRDPDVTDTLDLAPRGRVSGLATPGKSIAWLAHRVPFLRRPGRVRNVVIGLVVLTFLSGASLWVIGHPARKSKALAFLVFETFRGALLAGSVLAVALALLPGVVGSWMMSFLIAACVGTSLLANWRRHAR